LNSTSAVLTINVLLAELLLMEIVWCKIVKLLKFPVTVDFVSAKHSLLICNFLAKRKVWVTTCNMKKSPKLINFLPINDDVIKILFSAMFFIKNDLQMWLLFYYY